MRHSLGSLVKPVRVLTASAACLVVAGPVVAQAQDVTILLDRTDRAVELFVEMPARMAVDAFGLAPDQLTGPTGTVDFVGFREGTWDIGDALFANIKAQIGDEAAVFEGMSVMVHLADQRLPFETPLDGLTAISVCGVQPPETPPTLDDLYLYAGLIAFTDTPEAPLRLDLPADRQGAIEVRVRDYQPGKPAIEETLAVAPGAPLIIGTRSGVLAMTAGMGGMLFFAMMLGAIGLGVVLVRQRHT